MKKVILLAVAIALYVAPLALAHEEKDMRRPHGMTAKDSKWPIMGKSTMVASNDGGVIVMKGDKLYKYDKSLTLIKTVEVGHAACCDLESGKMCPLHSKTKGKDKDCGTGMKKVIQVKDVAPVPSAAVPVSPKQNFGPKN